MNQYEKALEVMKDLFAKDCQFSLATVKDNIPSVRVVDTYFKDGAFYVVTYTNTLKVQQLMENSPVALCHDFYRFTGNAYNIGHPLLNENRQIREKLIRVFEPWYFAHNNEEDQNMCYVKIDLKEGFFHKSGVGYKINFEQQEVEEFPVNFDEPLE